MNMFLIILNNCVGVIFKSNTHRKWLESLLREWRTNGYECINQNILKETVLQIFEKDVKIWDKEKLLVPYWFSQCYDVFRERISIFLEALIFKQKDGSSKWETPFKIRGHLAYLIVCSVICKSIQRWPPDSRHS